MQCDSLGYVAVTKFHQRSYRSWCRVEFAHRVLINDLPVPAGVWIERRAFKLSFTHQPVVLTSEPPGRSWKNTQRWQHYINIQFTELCYVDMYMTPRHLPNNTSDHLQLPPTQNQHTAADIAIKLNWKIEQNWTVWFQKRAHLWKIQTDKEFLNIWKLQLILRLHCNTCSLTICR